MASLAPMDLSDPGVRRTGGRSGRRSVGRSVGRSGSPADDRAYLEEHRDRDMFALLLKMSANGHPNVVRYLDFMLGS